jgi:hypothetical protein
VECESSNYTFSDGTPYEVVGTVFCPIFRPNVDCAFWDGAAYSSEGCEMVGFNSFLSFFRPSVRPSTFFLQLSSFNLLPSTSFLLSSLTVIPSLPSVRPSVLPSFRPSFLPSFKVGFNGSHVTCNCNHLTDFASRFASVGDNVNAAFSNKVSVEEVKQAIAVLVVIGSILTVYMALLVSGYTWDRKDAVERYSKEFTTSEPKAAMLLLMRKAQTYATRTFDGENSGSFSDERGASGFNKQGTLQEKDLERGYKQEHMSSKPTHSKSRKNLLLRTISMQRVSFGNPLNRRNSGKKLGDTSTGIELANMAPIPFDKLSTAHNDLSGGDSEYIEAMKEHGEVTLLNTERSGWVPEIFRSSSGRISSGSVGKSPGPSTDRGSHEGSPSSPFAAATDFMKSIGGTRASTKLNISRRAYLDVTYNLVCPDPEETVERFRKVERMEQKALEKMQKGSGWGKLSEKIAGTRESLERFRGVAQEVVQEQVSGPGDDATSSLAVSFNSNSPTALPPLRATSDSDPPLRSEHEQLHRSDLLSFVHFLSPHLNSKQVDSVVRKSFDTHNWNVEYVTQEEYVNWLCKITDQFTDDQFDALVHRIVRYPLLRKQLISDALSLPPVGEQFEMEQELGAQAFGNRAALSRAKLRRSTVRGNDDKKATRRRSSTFDVGDTNLLSVMTPRTRESSLANFKPDHQPWNNPDAQMSQIESARLAARVQKIDQHKERSKVSTQFFEGVRREHSFVAFWTRESVLNRSMLATLIVVELLGCMFIDALLYDRANGGRTLGEIDIGFEATIENAFKGEATSAEGFEADDAALEWLVFGTIGGLLSVLPFLIVSFFFQRAQEAKRDIKQFERIAMQIDDRHISADMPSHELRLELQKAYARHRIVIRHFSAFKEECKMKGKKVPSQSFLLVIALADIKKIRECLLESERMERRALNEELCNKMDAEISLHGGSWRNYYQRYVKRREFLAEMEEVAREEAARYYLENAMTLVQAEKHSINVHIKNQLGYFGRFLYSSVLEDEEEQPVHFDTDFYYFNANRIVGYSLAFVWSLWCIIFTLAFAFSQNDQALVNSFVAAFGTSVFVDLVVFTPLLIILWYAIYPAVAVKMLARELDIHRELKNDHSDLNINQAMGPSAFSAQSPSGFQSTVDSPAGQFNLGSPDGQFNLGSPDSAPTLSSPLSPHFDGEHVGSSSVSTDMPTQVNMSYHDDGNQTEEAQTQVPELKLPALAFGIKPNQEVVNSKSEQPEAVAVSNSKSGQLYPKGCDCFSEAFLRDVYDILDISKDGSLQMVEFLKFHKKDTGNLLPLSIYTIISLSLSPPPPPPPSHTHTLTDSYYGTGGFTATH